MSREYRDQIYYASPLHDIGKLAVPDTILSKTSDLNSAEWSVMRTHPEKGGAILKTVSSPFLKLGREIALTHHEKWDGSGYPRGLKGEEIPLSGRLTIIADQYDALRSKRPYKPALPHKAVVTILTQGDDRTHPGHFDPAVLDAFRRCEASFNEIFNGLPEDLFPQSIRAWDV